MVNLFQSHLHTPAHLLDRGLWLLKMCISTSRAKIQSEGKQEKCVIDYPWGKSRYVSVTKLSLSETGVRMISCKKTERDMGENESVRLKERWLERHVVRLYIQVSACDRKCHNHDHSALTS